MIITRRSRFSNCVTFEARERYLERISMLFIFVLRAIFLFDSELIRDRTRSSWDASDVTQSALVLITAIAATHEIPWCCRRA